ncbi:gamma-glutamyl-gamma-aminobutyrate hydrolase family protein [Leptolyngbya sp. FACHB-261]|uniref:gamma-glutamyl-gamma-aminobutyrate hydrolase family protein n=1 Tax=Leptolyngbya sp. FACHB-261 TaxID=2692806 RepID=UPI001684732D|nr:gamma-glutamyl-gamma-aminobutyrate hydrolase family protein [Leptolyngbya sp. FACHB-261]MBD2104275.1 gamma-glutamyl-gamma-aminobutyrate hydrolase family protein [Leptolyngbya sp. FACHB-261]
MTPAPIIGLTTYCRNDVGDFYLPGAYVDAIRAAGGVAVLLPPGETEPAQWLPLLNGLVLAGGGDIEPEAYGGQYHPTLYGMDPERDASELTLARSALVANLPVLGICRGLQILSVAAGSKLLPHVPDVFGTAVLHRKENPRRPIAHSVQLVSDSRLAELMGQTEVSVVSWHHQAIHTVPSGWRAVAHAADGVIEALEHISHPWATAVQWHPELSADDPLQRRLFQGLVEAAQQHKGQALSGQVLRAIPTSA